MVASNETLMLAENPLDGKRLVAAGPPLRQPRTIDNLRPGCVRCTLAQGATLKTAYLDIETDYVGPFRDDRLFKDFRNHKITVIGIRIVSESEDRFVQLVGAEVTRESLLNALVGVERIVTYNGRSKPDALKGKIGFDFPVIAAQLGVVLDEMFPHDDLVPLCWRKDLYGGQKKVEQTLGLRRQFPGRDGLWANQTWREYQRTQDPKLLDELLAYNKEDVFMLREIEEALQRK